eukprot:scaffold95598_cov33-Cyclotella_meneghiniana.AAC.1
MPRIDLVVAVWGLAGSWVDLGDCDIIIFVRLVVVVLSMSVCCLCVVWGVGCGVCYGQLRNKIRTQCGLSAILRTNTENCGQIADKCEHAGIKFFDMERKDSLPTRYLRYY